MDGWKQKGAESLRSLRTVVVLHNSRPYFSYQWAPSLNLVRDSIDKLQIYLGEYIMYFECR